jgi:hypothetical protein
MASLWVLLDWPAEGNSMALLLGVAPDEIGGLSRLLADLLASESRNLYVCVDETGVTAVVHRKLGDAAFVGASPVFCITTGPLRKSHNMSPSYRSRRHVHPSSWKTVVKNYLHALFDMPGNVDWYLCIPR